MALFKLNKALNEEPVEMELVLREMGISCIVRNKLACFLITIIIDLNTIIRTCRKMTKSINVR